MLYDSERDIAVLYVPGLRRPALQFANPTAQRGDSAIVAGFPENRPTRPAPPGSAAEQHARGPDIYHRGTVSREVYALRGRSSPGNSGGPLLDPDGKVYGVVFAAALDDPDTGYALTADEVAPDVRAGRNATRPVSTQRCSD